MTGVLLAIDLPYAMVATKTDKGSQCYFGCIRRACEHRFPKHGFSQCDAIQATDKLAIDPRFDAVRKASPVQFGIGCNHFRNDPCSCLSFPRAFRAGANDLIKGRVDSNFARGCFIEPLQYLLERSAYAEFRNVQYQSGIGAPPQRGLAFAEPGENPMAIGAAQSANIQQAACSQQSWCWGVFTPGFNCGREVLTRVKPGKWRGARWHWRTVSDVSAGVARVVWLTCLCIFH